MINENPLKPHTLVFMEWVCKRRRGGMEGYRKGVKGEVETGEKEVQREREI